MFIRRSRRICLRPVASALFVLLLCSAQPGPAHGQPVPADPSMFMVELYADFAPLGRLKAWELTFTTGQNGFPPGLYVTSGPIPDDRSDRLVRVIGPQQIQVVAQGLVSNETLEFPFGPYGTGMLVTEPQLQRIVRVSPDGTKVPFSVGFTPPFGPADLLFGPSPNDPNVRVLYASDFSSGDVVIVHPDGSKTVAGNVGVGYKDGNADIFNRYGNRFVGGTFNFRDNPDRGTIFTFSEHVDDVRVLLAGLNAIQLMTFGPGGVWGRDLFVATEGRDYPEVQIGDGGVYRLRADTTDVPDCPLFHLEPFLFNLDAASVAFDTDNVLGGGMFVADIHDDPEVASKIWRVTLRTSAVHEPVEDPALLGLGAPNPVGDGGTMIPFSLPNAGFAIVRIADASGRLIATVLAQDLAAGPHRAHWNGEDDEGQRVSSGVYYSILEINGHRKSRSLVVLK